MGAGKGIKLMSVFLERGEAGCALGMQGCSPLFEVCGVDSRARLVVDAMNPLLSPARPSPPQTFTNSASKRFLDKEN